MAATKRRSIYAQNGNTAKFQMSSVSPFGHMLTADTTQSRALFCPARWHCSPRWWGCWLADGREPEILSRDPQRTNRRDPMPRRHDTAVSLAGVTVTDAHSGASLDLGTLRGVHVLVLMRHRH